MHSELRTQNLKIKTHISGFDALRVIAVAAVIGIHDFYTDPSLRTVVRNFSFAVPCFVMVAVYLSAKSVFVRSSGKVFMKSRLVRLLPAFLAWSGAYVLARWIKGSIGISSFSAWAQYIFLGASAVHLYFIPMLLYYSLILIALPRAAAARMAVCTAGLCGAVWVRYVGIPHFELGSSEANVFPFYFFFNLPYLFLGVLVYDSIGSEDSLQWACGSCRREYLLFFALALAAIMLWCMPAKGRLWIEIRLILRDSLIFLSFIFWPVQSPKWLKALAGVSFGIYLCHHLFIEALLPIEGYLHLPTSSTWVTLSRFLICIAVSAGLCLFLVKHERTSWLVK